MLEESSITFHGDFETHLTVEADDSASLSALQHWAAIRELKCLHIELARGVTPSQPMLTWHCSGSLVDQFARIQSVSADLESSGYRVVRSKLEVRAEDCSAFNEDLSAADGSSRYFEHHVKLLLSSQDDSDALRRLAQRHMGHLSRNALRQRDDGFEERFVTQRCRINDPLVAAARLQCLLDELQAGSYTIIEIEAEYVVFDSNLSLDAGWILEGETDV